MINNKIIKPIPKANELVKIWREFGGNGYPIDVEKIINEFINQKYKSEKIIIYPRSLNSIEGCLIKNPDHWALVYNENIVNTGRKNFTIAHELGHYLCHRQQQDEFHCGDEELYRSDKEIEKEADRFASYLLMPIDDFKKEIDEENLCIDTFKYCSSRYGTSLMASILKWLDFTSKCAVLVKSRDDFVLWSWSSKLALTNKIHFKSGYELPETSLTRQKQNYELARNDFLPEKVWHHDYAVREIYFHSEVHEYDLTLLIFKGVSSDKYDYKEESEEEDCVDRFSKFS
jgi:Zn-dependent peptidase ImmA (M78 family)